MLPFQGHIYKNLLLDPHRETINFQLKRECVEDIEWKFLYVPEGIRTPPVWSIKEQENNCRPQYEAVQFRGVEHRRVQRTCHDLTAESKVSSPIHPVLPSLEK